MRNVDEDMKGAKKWNCFNMRESEEGMMTGWTNKRDGKAIRENRGQEIKGRKKNK
jgi:hypothetical protein